MAVKSIKIDADGGVLDIDHNVVDLSPGDTVEWNVVNLGPGRRLDIEFHLQGGIYGPFEHDPADDHNPARGWYGSARSVAIKSNGLRDRGMWKYDIILTHCASGRELDRKDPWIHFG